MFYSTQQALDICSDDPSLLFQLIKEQDEEVIEKIISNKDFNFNTIDEFGNNVIMILLKNKNYNLAYKYLDKVDINHQNKDGDTIMHILASINYINVKELIELVLNNQNFDLNIKNNHGETILDKSINSNYLYTSIKILEQERFNSIDVYSFKKMYDTYIKSNNYGKYSKLSNLEIIIDNMENKSLVPKLRKLLYLIQNNKITIEKEFNLSKTSLIDKLINKIIKEVVG